jgi:hypothetical protein
MSDTDDRPVPKPAESNTIKKLVPDPTEIPDHVSYSGHIGRSAEPGCFRLYPNPEDLTNYFELRDDDVLHHSPADGDRSTVWIKPDAKMRVVRVRPASEVVRRMRSLKLDTEVLRNLTVDVDPDMRIRPATVGRCTSADSCSLEPCCGGSATWFC